MFGVAVALRRAAYDVGVAPSERVDVPVVSVGNLSTGGTGKTPFCAFLVRELELRGLRPGICSRGYRSEPGRELNDEGRLLARLCPGVLQIQDKDRARGARELVAKGAGSIVLDDGFQHRRLQRDLDFVLVDATRPWGLPPAQAGDPSVCALLPRGLLREPPRSLARADAIVITRATTRPLAELTARIQELAPGRPILCTDHRPARLRDERGAERPIADLAGRTVDLVSAIGNPEAFEASVTAAGAKIRAHRVFEDHHGYAAEDVAGLGEDGTWLVTTAKDAVKLESIGTRFFAFEIELELLSGRAVLDALLDALPAGQRDRETRALHAGLHG
jgi:tetraacyldisaccharide 4'-kinase